MTAIAKSGSAGIAALKQQLAASNKRQETVVLCLDVSMSMFGNMDSLKEAARAFVLECHPEVTWIGLVAFSDEPKIVCPVSRNLAAVIMAIDSLDVVGSTNIGSAIGLASTMFFGVEDKVRRIVLMTDGETADSHAALDASRASGCVIDTVGFGHRCDVDLLREISSATGGVYNHAFSGEGLVQVFRSLEAHERKLLGEIK